VISAGCAKSPRLNSRKRTALTHFRYAIALPFPTNAKAHAPRSAGAGDGRGVGVMAWGGHEKWAADRGCHAATCSWKEIPRKHGCIHARSSPNPAPAQVTKPAPRSIGGTQANKLLLLGFGAHHQKSCHLHRRLISTRHHVIIAGPVMYPPETQQARTAPTSHQICHRSSIPHERLAHPRRGGKREFKLERYPPLDGAACWASFAFVKGCVP
jgi:hypothetical protein